MKGNLLVAHGGGPTPVINNSLRGVVEEAKKYGEIDGIWAARFGIEGVFNEDFIDMRAESDEDIKGLATTPASAIGSCRRKVKEQDYPVLLEKFKKYNIRFFFYNGGNDSMDTCHKISEMAKSSGYDMKVMGVPKTIDNDLDKIDHCPGFGSAAKYVGIVTREVALENYSLPIQVCIMETMGRNAGWLTAAALLAKREDDIGPHLIYMPEIPFDKEKFLEDVKAQFAKGTGCLVIASEGLKYANGKLIGDTGVVDDFGHTTPGGVAQTMCDMIIAELGIKARSEKPGLIARCSIPMQSKLDAEEAYALGVFAVKSMMEGKTGYMASLKRVSVKPYKMELELVPLADVANVEKKFPLNWINKRGNFIEKEFLDYCRPIIGEDIPMYTVLKKKAVPKK